MYTLAHTDGGVEHVATAIMYDGECNERSTESVSRQSTFRELGNALLRVRCMSDELHR